MNDLPQNVCVRATVVSTTFFTIILFGFVAGSGCNAMTASWYMPGGSKTTLPEFIGGIVSRSARLNYISEQDSEVFAFYRNTPVDAANAETLLRVLRRPAETRCIKRTWHAFFDTRTRIDPTGRWKEIREYLEAHLTDLIIVQLPRDAPYHSQYDLYAIGLFNGDTIVGIQMFGVAT